MTRDLTWAAIYDVAKRLNDRVEGSTPEVEPVRRRSLLYWTVTEGIAVRDNWTDVFEPVRRRRIFGKKWKDVQPVQEAASKVGGFLRERPDLQ